LCEFLSSPQAQIRQYALEQFAAISGQDDFPSYLTDSTLKSLKVMALGNNDAAKLAVTCLVNGCKDIKIIHTIASDLSFIKAQATFATSEDDIAADLRTMLLANLAKDDKIEVLVTATTTKKRSYTSSNSLLDQMIECFVQGENKKLNPNSAYDHIILVLCDISRFEAAQDLLMNENVTVPPIVKFFGYITSSNDLRKVGSIALIKNCLFASKHHDMLVKDYNILDILVYPLIGPEEIEDYYTEVMSPYVQRLVGSKAREPDMTVLLTALEAIMLLTATRKIRDYMRFRKIYPFIREVHRSVPKEQEDILLKCEELVNILEADEGPEFSADQEYTE
ncbi:hypothetical protein CANCADRAFT_11343, partial [Tortispora caseinolytica NRRL Y-17796]